jgi:hypothetical protein
LHLVSLLGEIINGIGMARCFIAVMTVLFVDQQKIVLLQSENIFLNQFLFSEGIVKGIIFPVFAFIDWTQ